MIGKLEGQADDAVAWCLQKLKQYKKQLILGVVFWVAVCHQVLLDYITSNVTEPFMAALSAGLPARDIGNALGLGLCSGLSAPGTTVVALFVLGHLYSVFVEPMSVPALAIAGAFNVALTLVDVLVWTSVFAPLGAKFVKGGRYIRPFIAGSIPWALACPVMWAVAYYFSIPLLQQLENSIGKSS